ncbi:MAG: hypothetical protein HRT42_01485 [Campylobacteraceae bacterium]|nr:hypothetical protein [Campylobacteraceae bacterium]
MKKSYLQIEKELLDQSLKFPNLVSQAFKKNSQFVNNFMDWLRLTENIMQKYKIPQCSQLAGLRSKILIPADKKLKLSKRRYNFQIAVSILNDSQEILTIVLSPISKKLDDSRDIIRQLLNVAYQHKIVDKNLEFNEILQTLLFEFSKHENLKTALGQIYALISQADTLCLLAEEVEFDKLPI